jgi:hypothetical protein
MIDIVKFDKWLELRRYITTKSHRTKIISTYKKLIENKKSIIDLEDELDKLIYKNKYAITQFDYELTIADISKYLMYEDYRRKEDEEVEKIINKKI